MSAVRTAIPLRSIGVGLPRLGHVGIARARATTPGDHGEALFHRLEVTRPHAGRRILATECVIMCRDRLSWLQAGRACQYDNAQRAGEHLFHVVSPSFWFRHGTPGMKSVVRGIARANCRPGHACIVGRHRRNRHRKRSRAHRRSRQRLRRKRWPHTRRGSRIGLHHRSGRSLRSGCK